MQGYPGNVFFRVRYALFKDSNTLTCTMTATTDEPTPSECTQCQVAASLQGSMRAVGMHSVMAIAVVVGYSVLAGADNACR